MRTTELLARVRSVDPLHDDAAADAHPVTAAHLASARRALDARSVTRPVPAARRGWRWRVVTVAAVAAVLPAAALVLAPQLPGRTPLLGTATAAGAGLECGTGYARAIPPSTADVRPFPTDLPPGWTVQDLFARSERSHGWCTTPSLNAASLDGAGLVVGSVTLTGPMRGVRVDGAATETPDRVGRYAAVRLGPPPSGAPSLLRWVVTDDSGEQWYAVTNGYPLPHARRLLTAATFTDRRVDWDAAVAPGLRVLHRRTGDPYPTTSTGEAWYVALGGAGRGRLLTVDSGRADASPGARAVVGTRLTTVSGRPALVYEQDGVPSSVVLQVRPGVLAAADVRGDLATVERLLAGLTELPADDPRLEQLRLREPYEAPGGTGS